MHDPLVEGLAQRGWVSPEDVERAIRYRRYTAYCLLREARALRQLLRPPEVPGDVHQERDPPIETAKRTRN